MLRGCIPHPDNVMGVEKGTRPGTTDLGSNLNSISHQLCDLKHFSEIAQILRQYLLPAILICCKDQIRQAKVI